MTRTPEVTLTDRNYHFSTTTLVKSYPEHFAYGADEYEIVVRVPADSPGRYRLHHRDLHYIVQPRSQRDVTAEAVERRRRYFEEVSLPEIKKGGNLLPAESVLLVVLRDLRESALRREFNSLGYSDTFDLYLFAVPGRSCFEPDEGGSKL